MKRAPLLLWVAAIVSGCTTVGPDYDRPLLPDPNVEGLFPEAEAIPSEGTGAITPAALASWWESLGDPLLTELIQKTLAENLDIRQAQSRVRVSRLLLGISRSGLYPHLDGGAVYKRSRASESLAPSPSKAASVQQAAGTVALGLRVADTVSLIPANPTGALKSIPGLVASWPVAGSVDIESDFYQTGFDAAWEIDIFGGTRRGVEAAKADLEATQESLNSLWVSLAGAVAQSYIGLRTYQARLQVAESNLAAQEETFDLLESLYRSGLSDELAVQQIRYVVESTRASIPPLRSGVEAAMNALAVLTGEMPGDLHEALGEHKPIPAAPLKVVTGIPANALRQRPDIRVAERQLAAQTARIGEAAAELYPKLVLSGSIGLESIKSSTLFDSGSDTWRLGPAISWPIFHAGAIRKNIQVQTELQEQYLAAYERAVLGAVEEVRNALVDYAQEQQRSKALRAAVDAAEAALEVAQDKYKNGLSDFNNVLDAQRSLLAFREQLAISEGVISVNLVRLYKALGGGWGPMEMP